MRTAPRLSWKYMFTAQPAENLVRIAILRITLVKFA